MYSSMASDQNVVGAADLYVFSDLRRGLGGVDLYINKVGMRKLFSTQQLSFPSSRYEHDGGERSGRRP